MNMTDPFCSDDRQRNALLAMLKSKFEERDLTMVAYHIFGSDGLQNLSGARDDRIIAFLELLRTRGRLGDLFEYIAGVRPDIDPREFGIVLPEPPPQPPRQIEFVNRFREIEYIPGPLSPDYYVISAPAGYGKTRLLEAVASQFSDKHWLTVSVALGKGRSYSAEGFIDIVARRLIDQEACEAETLTLKEWGFEFARRVYGRVGDDGFNGVVLIVDGIEAIAKRDRIRILNEFFPAFVKGLQGSYRGPLKIILAGRYVHDWSSSLAGLPWKVKGLDPFNFDIVQKTVKEFSTKPGESFFAGHEVDFAVSLMALTGGHPGCMAEILLGYQPGWPIKEYFEGRQGKEHEKLVAKAIQEIREGVPEDLRDIMDRLSVIRRFNDPLVQHLVQNDLLKWGHSAERLVDLLMQNYLVTLGEDGFVQDDMTRRLLAIRLRKQDPKLFERIREKAIEFYEARLADSSAFRADIIAREILFQRLQATTQVRLTAKQVQQWLTAVWNDLVQGRNANEVGPAFIRLLQVDWEIEFAVNYALAAEEYTDKPYQGLLGRAQKLLKKRKE